jgi:hypothetical protein
MIKLNGMFSVSRKIGCLLEIKKMIGTVIEYTIIHKESIYMNGNLIMIQKNVFSAKKDFFTKLRSI